MRSNTVRMLIVEDNPVACGFLARVARESFNEPIEVTEAGDLMSARKQVAVRSPPRGSRARANGAASVPAAVEPFQLILVDLELPDGSGVELLAETADYPATKIVTTLYSDDEHIFPALQWGADGYLLKEDPFESLVEELQKIVRGEPPLSPAVARRLLQHFRKSTSPSPREVAVPAAFVSSRTSPLQRAAPFDHERLTPRETEVLTYLSKGFTIKEIATLMEIKWFTVNDHIKAIYKKLNVSSRAEAAVLASKQGLV